MEKLKLYSVSDKYIDFLRADEELTHIYDNKKGTRKHTRKYLGVALSVNNKNYFIPLSSPKNKDYELCDGKMVIKKDSPIIIRLTALNDRTKKLELKGTLKINCMIPVPESELTPYNINEEQDENYKIIIQKEYKFISKNSKYILDAAKLLYSQRENFENGKYAPSYISDVISFKYAEKKMDEFVLIEEKNSIATSIKAVEHTADKIEAFIEDDGFDDIEKENKREISR